MKSEVIFNVKDKEIKKDRTRRLIFVSAIIIVLSVVILNLIAFIIT